MVGRCSQDAEIKKIIREYDLDISLKDITPNFNLPQILNQAKVFILPSYYEGHPKTLLEAMSCALPCIGTDVNGIKQDIQHMETGYLCDTNHKSIADAIETVLSDKELQEKLGKNAREYVVEKYAIDKILPMELTVIEEVMNI